MAETIEQVYWRIEYGIRTKNPSDSDYDFMSQFVQRVPTGIARFTCSGHYDSGWQPTRETTRLAGEHLAGHGIELPKENGDA